MTLGLELGFCLDGVVVRFGVGVWVLIQVKVCISIMISARVLVEVSIMFVVVVGVIVGVEVVDWFGLGVCNCVRFWALVGDGVEVRVCFVVVV